MKKPILLFLWIAFSSAAWSAIDTTLPSDAEILKKLKTHLAGRGDTAERDVRRLGNRTIELENFISTEMDTKMAATIFADYQKWPRWVLPNINEKPSGGSYLLQLHALEFLADAANSMKVTFSFEIPLFRGNRLTRFRLGSTNVNGVYTLTGDLSEAEGTLASVHAVLKLFPQEGSKTRSWIYVDARAQLKSVVLYEALPERLLKREASERVRILLDNYAKEETQRRGSARR